MMKAENNSEKTEQVLGIMSTFGDILLCLNLKNENDDYQVISVFKECLDYMTGQVQIPPSMKSIRFHVLFSGYSNTSKPLSKFFITMSAILDNNMNDLLDTKNMIMLMKFLQEYDPEMDLIKQAEFFEEKAAKSNSIMMN